MKRGRRGFADRRGDGVARTVIFSRSLHDALDQIARQEGSPLSETIREACRDYIRFYNRYVAEGGHVPLDGEAANS